ncbi:MULTISPECIES: TRAFs-binding domain-containing protein [unclassified Variovorax]|uniref:TRAFs-binding domain-containing protein n=1 Tax=unclassified Variovorax TaxID=663243 RepID=UPI001BD2A758|nr:MULTISPECIES: TRAFs-binding domain-containing protein [unclassified Variovorax]
MSSVIVKPLCFMVMPYGVKATQAEPGKGPVEIDFNALWDKAYVPVIEALGYQPVRADQDTGALIITQMLERLYFADLVLADMTIPNGNVYYEIGIRHAARRRGCVLLAADWSSQLFDVAQMRTIRYPLPEGAILPETAAAIQARIKDAIEGLAAGESPMHVSIPGYPTQVDEATAAGMKDQMALLSAFQAEVRAVRAYPKKDRMMRAQALADTYAAGPMIGAVAIALMLMLRDCANTTADWNLVVKFIDGLSAPLRAIPEVTEQRALALSYAGQHVDAIAAVEAMDVTSKPTPELLGLLGGRYKRLFKEATTPEDAKKYLNRSIDYYEKGMQLDLNEYYCSSNLPRLYRVRQRPADEKLALSVVQLTIAACERARKRGSTDIWLPATLLGAAFDSGDPDKAEALADEVESGDPAEWQLDTTIDSLRLSLTHVTDDSAKARLSDVIDRLDAL